MGCLKNHGFFKDLKNSVIEFYKLHHWGTLNMEVYDGNWEARVENKREKLVHRIKQHCRLEYDLTFLECDAKNEWGA